MPTSALGGLAFVIAALLVGRAYRYGSSHTRSASQRSRIAGIATVLMVGAILAGSLAAGPLFAERPEGEDLPRAQLVVAGAGVLALAVGAGLRAGATREREVRLSGVRGRAVVNSIHREGLGYKGIPVWELDMDVEAPDVASFHVVLREAIPDVMAETIEVGEPLPVYVEPGTERVALDWISSRDPGFGEGFSEGRPARRAFDPVQVSPPPPLAPPGTLTVAPRVVPVVITIVLLGLAGTLVNRVFESDRKPVVVPPGDHASTAPGAGSPLTGLVGMSRTDEQGREVGFTFALPAGWADLSDQREGPDGQAIVDVFLRWVEDASATIVVSRSHRYTTGPLPSDAGLETLLPALYRELGNEITASEALLLDGQPSMRFDMRISERIRQRYVVTVREGQVIFVTLVAPPARWEEVTPAFAQALGTWHWD